MEPITVGHTIVATWEPHEDTVLHVIHEQGLELQVIFNKGAVMVLPSGVNKATGLLAALLELGLSPHNVVAVGDAENDHALLGACECGVAVANALDALKDHADLVLREPHGVGVRELIEHLLANDLAAAAPALVRHHLLLGKVDHGDARIDPYEANVLICGTSGSGKSTLTNGLLERLQKRGYQYAIVDPEGDYAADERAVVLGAPKRAPMVSEIADVRAAARRTAFAFWPAGSVLGNLGSKAREVEVAMVVRQAPSAGNIILTAGGYIVPRRRVGVSSKVGGRVDTLLVDKGDIVAAGQVLERLDSRELQAQLAQVRANKAAAEARLKEALAGSRTQEIQRAKAALDQAEANVRTTKLNLDRAQQLSKAGVFSKQILDEAQNAYDVALAQEGAAARQHRQHRQPSLVHHTRM